MGVPLFYGCIIKPMSVERVNHILVRKKDGTTYWRLHPGYGITHGRPSTYATGCRCKECHQAHKTWAIGRRLINPEHKKQIQRESYQRNRRKRLSDKLKKSYGITIDQRDKLFESQNFKCAVCNRIQITNIEAFHIDHNHSTGKIRGILCHHCNLALGLLRE